MAGIKHMKPENCYKILKVYRICKSYNIMPHFFIYIIDIISSNVCFNPLPDDKILDWS